MEANKLDPVIRLNSWKQSDLGPYYLQYRLCKNVREQTISCDWWAMGLDFLTFLFMSLLTLKVCMCIFYKRQFNFVLKMQ